MSKIFFKFSGGFTTTKGNENLQGHVLEGGGWWNYNNKEEKTKADTYY